MKADSSDTKPAEMTLETMNAFFVYWMSGHPLKNCLDWASEYTFLDMPLPVPGNEKFYLRGVELKRSTSRIFVIGHSGLTVNGLNPSYDGYYAK